MPKGGARPGTGPKTQSAESKWLGGDAAKTGAGKEKPKLRPLPVLPPPDGLPERQAEVWVELAPLAAAARTLTPGTAMAFQDLCEAIVLKRMMFAEIMTDGLTGQKVTLQMDEKGGGLQSVEKKAHTLLSQHRGMMQRVEAGLLRFRLSPMGKELAVSEPDEADPFDEFDGPTNSVQ